MPLIVWKKFTKKISDAKIKESILNGLYIRKLSKDNGLFLENEELFAFDFEIK